MNAQWYLADIVMEIRVQGNEQNIVHVNLTLIRASSPEEAYNLALEVGKQSEITYQNTDGDVVTMIFRGLRNLDVIHEDLQHGSEIAFEEMIGLTEEQIIVLVQPKETLNVFQSAKKVSHQMNPLNQKNPRQTAAQIKADIDALPNRYTDPIRAIRRQYSQALKGADSAFMFALAHLLIEQCGQRYGQKWFAYELLKNHKAAFQAMGDAEMEAFSVGIEGWDDVDSFTRTLSGPAWLKRQISDDLIHRWARSENLWRRRMALVSTVALNMRSQGGKGDIPRTLAVCEMLVADKEDMIVKALSWALRISCQKMLPSASK